MYVRRQAVDVAKSGFEKLIHKNDAAKQNATRALQTLILKTVGKKAGTCVGPS